jgi:hypothetical protein
MDEGLKSMLPKIEENVLRIEYHYDAANNKLYFQTKPCLAEDGTIRVRRVAEYDVAVDKAYTLVSEYKAEAKLPRT